MANNKSEGDVILMNAVSGEVKRVIIELGMNVNKVAKAIGIPQRTLDDNIKRKSFSITTIHKIIKLCNNNGVSTRLAEILELATPHMAEEKTFKIIPTKKSQILLANEYTPVIDMMDRKADFPSIELER